MTRMTVRKIIKIALLGMAMYCAQSLADTNDAGAKVAWSYQGKTGPEYWGKLDSAFEACANGKLQSPINIQKDMTAKNVKLALNYQSAPLRIVNDGMTELMINDNKTIFNDGHTIQLNFPSETLEKINYDGKDYQLVQFHIHTPSENKWQGHAYPMELHFVHQGAKGTLAVIGVFVRNGKENPAFREIVAHLPKHKGDIMTVSKNINPGDLMPVRQDYYSFAGSLTTPPCSEGVQWVVMAEPITASAVQIAKLKRAINMSNARPVQPLHERKVFWAVNP